MKLVPIEKIPTVEEITDVDLDDLAGIYKVCVEMRALCEASQGIGLAAVQVGIPWKLFLVKSDGASKFDKEGSYGFFLNCEYKPATTEKVDSLEGCLSIRSPSGQLRHFQVERFSKIQLSGFRLTDLDQLKLEQIKDTQVDVSEQGIVFQHEIDHQLGVLISDIGEEVFLWRQGE